MHTSCSSVEDSSRVEYKTTTYNNICWTCASRGKRDGHGSERVFGHYSSVMYRSCRWYHDVVQSPRSRSFVKIIDHVTVTKLISCLEIETATNVALGRNKLLYFVSTRRIGISYTHHVDEHYPDFNNPSSRETDLNPSSFQYSNV